MYSVCYIIDGKRVWSVNPKTHAHYFKTRTAYHTHLENALVTAQSYKSRYPSHRIEVEAFYNKQPCFYITII